MLKKKQKQKQNKTKQNKKQKTKTKAKTKQNKQTNKNITLKLIANVQLQTKIAKFLLKVEKSSILLSMQKVGVRLICIHVVV